MPMTRARWVRSWRRPPRSSTGPLEVGVAVGVEVGVAADGVTTGAPRAPGSWVGAAGEPAIRRGGPPGRGETCWCEGLLDPVSRAGRRTPAGPPRLHEQPRGGR